MIRRNSLRRVLSSFHRIIALRNFLAITAVSIGLNSCYNEPESLGGNLLPSDDLTAIKIDTITNLSAFTVESDPDSINTQAFSYGVLGCLNSKIFGRTKADFLTQVYLGKTRGSNPLFGSEASLDSLVLTFRLYDHYGDKSQALGIRLYELKDTLSSYLTYKGLVENVDNWYEPTAIYSGTYAGDSILRINFSKNNAFAKKIFNADLDSATVSSDKNFKNYFKGFYLTCDDIVDNDKQGVMYSFDFKNTETTMNLYYHRNDSALVYAFILGSQIYVTPRFNHINHLRGFADPAYSMKYVNQPIQDTVFYVEGLGGAHGYIKFDGIDDWIAKVQKPIAINRAELRIEQENYPTGLPKDSLSYLYYYADETSDGIVYTEDQKYAIQQQVATSSKYNKAKKYYSINLTEHIQAIITGKVSKKSMYVLPLNSPYSGARNVLRSGNSRSKMKLIITYSKL